MNSKTGTLRSEEDLFAELSSLCSSPGYVHAIAYLCFRDCAITYEGEVRPDDMRQMVSADRLLRTEISTLIGLLMKQKVDFTVPPPTKMQQYIGRTDMLLREIHDSMAHSFRIQFAPEQSTSNKNDGLAASEMLRETIFYSGESAYSFQYRDLAVRKYAADAEWITAKKAFSMDAAVQVLQIATRIQEEKTVSVVDALLDKHPDEWTILGAFEFRVEEIAQRSGLIPSTVRDVLVAFTFPEGETNASFKSLNDFNAANAFPLLSRGNDTHLMFQVYSFAEALYDAPFYWMTADDNYRPKAMRHRGQFAEEVGVERLTRVFGAANVFQNVEILGTKRKKLGEIDVLVLFGDRAVVLQAKSKRLTLEARRGNVPQIREDFRKSVQDAYDQGLACAKLLLAGGHELRAVCGRSVALPTSIRQIFILCVVSDHYPALSFQAQQFLSYEVEREIAAPFVMDVFTLDAVTEMLNSPLRFLSYLDRRTGYSQRLLSSNELTILSYHLTKNLWLENDCDLLTLSDDISAELDIAMAARRGEMPGKETPDGILTRYKGTPLGNIISEIETHPDPATIQLGFLLLTLSESAVSNLNRSIDLIRKRCISDGKPHDLTVPMPEAGTGITIHCNNRPAPTAIQGLHRHCVLRKYAQHASSWFGLCLGPEDAGVKFGTMLEFPWQQDRDLEKATATFAPAISFSELFRDERAPKKTGRNEPCPCGSGRKYKRCCGG